MARAGVGAPATLVCVLCLAPMRGAVGWCWQPSCHPTCMDRHADSHPHIIKLEDNDLMHSFLRRTAQP